MTSQFYLHMWRMIAIVLKGGHLGFVYHSSVFKTKGGGEGLPHLPIQETAEEMVLCRRKAGS